MRRTSDRLHGRTQRNGKSRPYQIACRRGGADFSAHITFETPPALRLVGCVRGANPAMPRCAWDTRGVLRQPLPDPNEGCWHRRGVAPFTLAIAIGEIEGQRRRMGVDDDLGPAKGARGLFRELEQNAAVALALKIAADGDEAKTCLGVADEVDAHRAYDLAVADEHTAGLES